MLEVWHEIKVELEQENIRPVSPDVDNMMEISRILNDRAAGVASTQVSLREQTERGENGGGGVKYTCTLFLLEVVAVHVSNVQYVSKVRDNFCLFN